MMIPVGTRVSSVYGVPSGWRLFSVDQIKSTDQYACVAGPFGSSIASKFFVNDGVPVIRGSNLRVDLTRFVPDDFVFISEDKAASFRAQQTRPGDLVFTCWGTIGQVGIVPEGLAYDRFIVSNKQLKLRVNLQIADPLFCFYYFASEKYVQYIRGRNIGGAVPGINLGILKSFPIALPTLSEQKRIVAILSAYDDLIANNVRRIELLERSARLLFEEWFVRLRYPGHEHDKAINGVPEGWSRKNSGSIAITNAECFSSKNLPDQIAYVDIASVKEGRIVTKTRLMNEEAPGRARRRAKDGDVIWSNVRPNLRQFALVLDPDELDVFSTGFTILTSTSVPWSFLYLATTSIAFVAHLINHTTGASYPAVRPNDFERAEILVPSDSLLEEFHTYCEPLFRLCHKLDHENERLARARDLLLPRLMDGRIEV